MKKMQIPALVLVCFMCLLNLQQTKAQDATTGIVNLKVTLGDILALSIPTGANQVNLSLTTLEEYTIGTNTTIPDQLLVSSTLPYNINVKANNDFTFVGTPGDLSSDVSTDVVTIGLGSNTNLTGSPTSVQLSGTDQSILTGDAASLNKLLNVDYSISATNAHNLFNNAKGDYTTTLTYTITND